MTQEAPEPDRRHCRAYTTHTAPDENGSYCNQNAITTEGIKEKHAPDVWTEIYLAP